MSDLHIGGSEDGVERAMRVQEYKYRNELPGPLDAVMATGAITDQGRPESATRRWAVGCFDRRGSVRCRPWDSASTVSSAEPGRAHHAPGRGP
ncbi:hypothetical protein ACFZAE_29040 [Streptomyces scabiei]|uniref:hypothetical protein n=1 Tax=Streptomyces scabiei TaxID=1930 RepID=UPI0036EAFD5F